MDSLVESSTAVPNVNDGIEYWKTQPASYDGVLGGFGMGTLPRIDSLGSRLFLLHLFPELSAVPSAIRPLQPKLSRRTRALDVGAGVGRVTSDVLLHLVSDVVLLEPVEHFVQQALANCRASASAEVSQARQRSWKGLADGSKSVTILQGTLQDFDPMNPHRVTFLDRIGYQPTRPLNDIDMGFDVIWCHHAALRDKENGRSLIVVKENICQDMEDGSACTVFDEQDSSLTRSDMAWKNIFKQAGLELLMEKIQDGLPDGLYVVKMLAFTRSC
ncbi:hypothetical protein H0H87_010783 [Tephrocybe sp. NHM501043]|nr:hypothetical protein H0H87_010783 [Tephrocybe sp. NHM501043]